MLSTVNATSRYSVTMSVQVLRRRDVIFMEWAVANCVLGELLCWPCIVSVIPGSVHGAEPNNRHSSGAAAEPKIRSWRDAR
jgi:hypothetical protein